MSTRSQPWSPPAGWDTYTRSDDVEELAWEVLAGWHYLNPTASTSVWESPEGSTVYIAFDDARAIIEVMIGRATEEDPDLEDFTARLRALGLSLEK
ncbi:MAG: hypothetical protein AAGA54_07295 [Myxococcota bacterium]